MPKNVLIGKVVEAAGVELSNVFCLCNLQILKDPQNQKIDNSQGHRTVIVQSHEGSHAKPSRTTSGIAKYAMVSHIVHVWIPRQLEPRPRRSAKTRPVLMLAGAPPHRQDFHRSANISEPPVRISLPSDGSRTG